MKKIKEHKYPLVAIFLVSVILMLPMFLRSYTHNDDTWFHLINIGLIEKAIENNFFSGFTTKILPVLANSFGYGTRLFYPPLAHTLGAYLTYFLSFFQIGILGSMKVLHFLELLASGLTMYLCAYSFHKKKYQSFLASVIYMAACYHLSDMYIRDALGESFIFVFLPLIVLGIKNLFDGNTKKFYLYFIIGYVGGILSHFTLMIYVTLILAVAFLFESKKVFKKEFLKPFILATLVILGLCAFYFEPMMEHRFFGNYMVYKKWVMSWGIWHTTFWGTEYFWHDPASSISFRFSVIVLILLGIAIIKNYKTLWSDKWRVVTVFGILSLWMTTRYFFLWLYFPYMLFMIQFGWRLVIFVVFAVSLIAPLAITSKTKKSICISMIPLIILSGMLFLPKDRGILNLEEVDLSAAVGWQKEYFPVQMVDTEENLEYYQNRSQDIIITSGNGTIALLPSEFPNLQFSLRTDSTATLEFPRIYYLGYQLKNEKKERFSLKESEHGFLESELPEGTYTLEYKGTIGYKISVLISFSTLLTTIAIAIIQKRKRA